MRSVFLFVLTLFLLSASGTAHAEKRVALIVGMSKYQQVPQLANPARDAEAVSALFKRVGFDVVDTEHDLGIADLRRAIRNFSETTRDADIAVIYYAGHGIEVDGNNYLIPTDAKLLSDFDVEDETVSVDRVLKAMDGAKRLKLVILDACRDNPFAKTMTRSATSRSIGRGLAKVEPPMSDTLIAFAAKAGAVAGDGDGANSPFAAALVKYITEPGLDVRIAFGRVRDDVLKSTGNRQEPFVYGSLGGDTMALVPKQIDPNGAARVDYELAAQVSSLDAWQSFLRAHSEGLYADLARAQLNKLQEAQLAREEADAARRAAEAQASQKEADFRRQVEEQSARQTAEAKQKISDQAKKELEESRQRLAEQTKKELDDAKKQLEQAQQQAEEARKQVEEIRRQAVADAQAQVERAKRDAKEEAEKMASRAPAQVAPQNPQAAPPQIDASDVVRLLQAHLKRLGCNPGNSEGTWDESSRKALALFNQNAQTNFDIKVASLDALDAVRSKKDRVCPLVCAKGQRPNGDRCVQISCSSGYFLNSGGECEKRSEPTPKPPEVVRHETSPQPRTIQPSRGGGKCFSFGGKTYCE
jgi:uncharacterized caspase-like protein